MTINNNNRVVFQVTTSETGIFIKDFLRSKDISERALKKLRNNGKILCNGQTVTWRKVVSTGDEIVLVYPTPVKNRYLQPESIPLKIIYEDADIVIVNKQPGICVHPTKAHPTATLANGLMDHWLKNNPQASFHAVNRIDRNTSGLVLIAKNSFSAQKLFLQKQQQMLSRSYLALVQGKVVSRTARVDLPIVKCDGQTTKRQVAANGQRAVTCFEVLDYFRDCTLLRLNPETGRTHQIRVHLSHVGHPLVGDELYGGSTKKIGRHCLHANQLSFFHPRTGQAMIFELPLPADMARASG
ncbi:RluA family pseudouridine synthase [Desulforamulus aeronauticus]|uniref:Pseudouridine synthase n=1 Tax=Desulforamulus aeronauticus DSM 10349 TaxID=1121421 RepID=A0A1M6P3Q7_9FIRM|nr:RluA family pseudouridine synthase [Desulforamulus aeronauticus]SHK02540.1 23S rRNA pseudouridine1911/1915/1917 synthase [Desulforamulus aeronauticus DSM 10349]